MAVGDVAKIRVRWTHQGQLCYTIFHFVQQKPLGDPLQSLLVDWATLGSPTPLTAFRQCCTTLTFIEALEAAWSRSLSFDSPSAAVGAAGTRTAQANEATGMGGLISWRTGFAGRRFRGRSYLPFPGTTSGQSLNSANGLWSSNCIAAMEPLRTQLPLVFGPTADWGFCIFSRQQEAQFPGYAPPLVAFGIIDPRPATQRRRSLINRTP